MTDEAFKRGYDDEMAGVSWLANPYPENTTEARRWVDGKVKAIQDKRDTPQRGDSNG